MKFIASLLLVMSFSGFAQTVTQEQLTNCYFTAYAHITKNWLGLELSEEEFVYRANFVMSRTGLKKNRDTFVQVSAPELLGKNRKYKQGLTPKHPFFDTTYGFGDVSAALNAKLKEEAEQEFAMLPECDGVFLQ